MQRAAIRFSLPTRFSLPLLALLSLLAAPALAQDWAGRGRVQGRVTDQSNQPIEGVTVQLLYKGQEGQGPPPLKTNKAGKWSILGLGGGEWTINLDKEGFVPSQGSMKVSEGGINPNVDVQIQRLEDTDQAKKGRAVMGALEEANAAAAAGQYAKARELYEKALPELAEDSKPAVRLAIAQSLVLEGKLDQALTALEQLRAAQPNDLKILKLEANVYGQKGDDARALALLEQVVAGNPQDYDSVQTIANMLLAKGREEEAKKYVAMLPADKKLDPNVLLNIGIQKYNDKNYAGAVADFDRVVQQDAKLPDAYYYRGLAHLANGNVPAAKADFQKVIELAPNSKNAAEAKEFLKGL